MSVGKIKLKETSILFFIWGQFSLEKKVLGGKIKEIYLSNYHFFFLTIFSKFGTILTLTTKRAS